jgi:hypothetical protein
MAPKSNLFAFSKFMLSDQGFRNVGSPQLSGFQLQMFAPYYRNLILSLINDLELTVDGEEIPRESIRFSIHGNTYSLDAMEKMTDDCWDFGKPAVIDVAWPGGLAAGKHDVRAVVTFRVSYLPFDTVAENEKELQLQS